MPMLTAGIFQSDTPVGCSTLVLEVGGEPSIGQGTLRRGQGQYGLKQQAQRQGGRPQQHQESQEVGASSPQLYQGYCHCQAAAGCANQSLQAIMQYLCICQPELWEGGAKGGGGGV